MNTPPKYVKPDCIGGASISDCGRYRWTLDRVWGDTSAPRCLFVMLNPSTADAFEDDPTVTRCIRYAYQWGYPGLTVANLYALRATDPRRLWAVDDPVGPLNDLVLGTEMARAEIVLCAWGSNPKAERVARFRELARECGASLYALALTAKGQPRHPLYLRADLTPQPWPV